MAIKKVSIGSLTNFHQYDDGDYDKAMIIEQPISCTGTPVDANDLVKMNTITNTTQSDAVITDNSIVRGDGGARKIQSSAWFINDAGDIYNTKIMLTASGGVAIKLTNKTGGNSVKGEVVTTDSANNNAAIKIVVDVPNPIGVFYESGIADGAEAWIVVSGIADVYFIGNTTRGHLARGFLTADGGSYVTGQALSEALPGSPFAVDKHFYEIGHVLESRTGAGLAKVVLHFN